MHSVAVLTSLVKSLLNLNFVCMTRCTERESLILSQVFYAKSEANCCKHVRAGQADRKQEESCLKEHV